MPKTSGSLRRPLAMLRGAEPMPLRCPGGKRLPETRLRPLPVSHRRWPRLLWRSRHAICSAWANVTTPAPMAGSTANSKQMRSGKRSKRSNSVLRPRRLAQNRPPRQRQRPSPRPKPRQKPRLGLNPPPVARGRAKGARREAPHPPKAALRRATGRPKPPAVAPAVRNASSRMPKPT